MLGLSLVGSASPVEHTMGAATEYFACKVSTHCQNGQNLAAYIGAKPPTPAPTPAPTPTTNSTTPTLLSLRLRYPNIGFQEVRQAWCVELPSLGLVASGGRGNRQRKDRPNP